MILAYEFFLFFLVSFRAAARAAAVIGLIVEGSNQELGALTARLGNLPGVEVKSALVRKTRSAAPEGLPPNTPET